MSFWDSVKRFTQPYSDEEYEYEEEAEGFEEEEQESAPRARRTSPFGNSGEDAGSSYSTPSGNAQAATPGNPLPWILVIGLVIAIGGAVAVILLKSKKK